MTPEQFVRQWATVLTPPVTRAGYSEADRKGITRSMLKDMATVVQIIERGKEPEGMMPPKPIKLNVDHLARFFVAGLLMAFRGMSPSTANWEVQQAWKHTREEDQP